MYRVGLRMQILNRHMYNMYQHQVDCFPWPENFVPSPLSIPFLSSSLLAKDKKISIIHLTEILTRYYPSLGHR